MEINMRSIALPFFLVATFLLSFSACLPGGSLKKGSDAPDIKVSRWVKGYGPRKFEAGKVYVVEFWATWCPPCRTTIPHLTEMARAYEGKVTFIGVSVWEQGSGQALEDNVDAFVRSMGDKMDYLVARDTATGFMAKKWMKAARQNGIPAAFLVDGNGKIAWIGHPMDSMEKEIDRVLTHENK
jgi:thiol-disulfide isomerase/thioredoxin